MGNQFNKFGITCTLVYVSDLSSDLNFDNNGCIQIIVLTKH